MKTMKLACALAGALALGACPNGGTSPATSSQDSVEDTRVYILAACPGESRNPAAAAARTRYGAALTNFRGFDSALNVVASLSPPPERANEIRRLRERKDASLLSLAALAASPNSGAPRNQRQAADDLQEAILALQSAEATQKQMVEESASQSLQNQIASQVLEARRNVAEKQAHFYETVKEPTLSPLFAVETVIGAAIATAVIPALVDVSLELIASAVREASKDNTKIASAVSTTHLHGFPPSGDPLPEPDLTVNPAFRCLVVVSGKFTSAGEPVLSNHDEFQKSVGIALPGDLYFYVSSQIEFSNDNSAFRLVPTAALINRYIDGATGGRAPEVVLNLTITSGRTTRDATPLALATLSLPKMELRKSLGVPELAGSASGWTAFPGGDPVAKDSLQGLEKIFAAFNESRLARRRVATFDACKSHLDSLSGGATSLDLIQRIGQVPAQVANDCWPYIIPVQRAALDTVVARAPATRNDATDKNAPVLAARLAFAEIYETARRDRHTVSLEGRRQRGYKAALESAPLFTPVTIEVDIIENRKGSPFMKAVADVLDKSKKGVSDALVASLSPAERAKRRADEEQQTRTNRTAVATAQDNVKLRQAELDDLPATASRAERVRAENALRQAKIAANNAYLADGRGIPYPEAQP